MKRLLLLLLLLPTIASAQKEELPPPDPSLLVGNWVVVAIWMGPEAYYVREDHTFMSFSSDGTGSLASPDVDMQFTWSTDTFFLFLAENGNLAAREQSTFWTDGNTLVWRPAMGDGQYYTYVLVKTIGGKI